MTLSDADLSRLGDDCTFGSEEAAEGFTAAMAELRALRARRAQETSSETAAPVRWILQRKDGAYTREAYARAEDAAQDAEALDAAVVALYRDPMPAVPAVPAVPAERGEASSGGSVSALALARDLAALDGYAVVLGAVALHVCNLAEATGERNSSIWTLRGAVKEADERMRDGRARAAIEAAGPLLRQRLIDDLAPKVGVEQAEALADRAAEIGRSLRVPVPVDEPDEAAVERGMHALYEVCLKDGHYLLKDVRRAAVLAVLAAAGDPQAARPRTRE